MRESSRATARIYFLKKLFFCFVRQSGPAHVYYLTASPENILFASYNVSIDRPSILPIKFFEINARQIQTNNFLGISINYY
jgi:hypothetical protein